MPDTSSEAKIRAEKTSEAFGNFIIEGKENNIGKKYSVFIMILPFSSAFSFPSFKTNGFGYLYIETRSIDKSFHHVAKSFPPTLSEIQSAKTY